jgi:outer membrane protein TolC
LPQLRFNGSLPDYGENLIYYSNGDTSYQYKSKERAYYGNFRLSQKLPSDASLSVNYIVSNTDNFNNNNRNFNTQTKISFDQPITSLFVYNKTAAEFKEAKLTLELAQKKYKRNELDLIYEVSSLFYDCMTADKQKEIASQTLKRQEEAFKLAKNKYETGLIKEVEALQIEVDYGDALNNYDSELSTYIQSTNKLKLGLGIQLTDSISIIDTLTYKTILIDQNKAIELGLQNRTELKERQIQIKLNELNIKQQQSKGTIDGSIGVYYNLAGTSSTTGFDYPYWSAFQTSSRNMFNEPGAYGINFTVTIPILDWGSNHSLVKMQKSVLEQNKISYQYEVLSIENEIRNTINKINSNLKKLLLLEKTVKLAERSYNISYQRFTNGDIDVEALGLDRIRYTNAQNSRLQAYINYKLQLLDLTRKTFYDFENNAPLVEESKN